MSHNQEMIALRREIAYTRRRLQHLVEEIQTLQAGVALARATMVQIKREIHDGNNSRLKH
jgi:hypothetical protein